MTFDITVRHGRVIVDIEAPIWVITFALLLGFGLARWIVLVLH